MLLILGAGILINFHKLQVTAVKTETSTVSETTTVQEPIIVSETTTEQEPVTKVTYSSVGGSEYELTTFKEKLVVGEKGQIRRPQNSPLKDSIYSFAMTVSDPSVLSFDEEGNWTAHKAGKTDVTFGFPSGDSAQAKKFNEELTKLNVELEVKDVAVTMTITVVEPESQVMYRLYNPNNKEHFYTASLHEKDTLVDIGWGFYEGLLGRHQVRVSLFIAFTILFLRIIIIPWINMKSVFYRASMVGKKKGLLGTREVLKRYIASSIRA